MPEAFDKAQDLSWVLEKLAAAKKQSSKPSSVSKRPAPATFKPPAAFKQVAPALGKEEKKQELQKTKATELDLWKTWHTGGQKPKDLDPLLKSLNPYIQSKASVFKNRVEIPTSAIDFEMKKMTVKALQTYNPDKGKLGTWVGNHLKKVGRFINTNQNFARIPENVSQKIGDFNRARAELSEKLGHEPDAHSLAEHTGFSLKMVKRLNKEQRKGLIAQGHAGLEGHPALGLNEREHEVANLIIPQLSPEERIVHEYSLGLNGRQKLKPGEIAKKLKWDASKVSKVRTSILNKMSPYLEP